MKKKRTQAFLIPILLSLPLLQMVAVLIVGEVYLRWTVVILSVLFYLLLATNCIFWYHLNRKIDVYHQRINRKLESLSIVASPTPDAEPEDGAIPDKAEIGNDRLCETFRANHPEFLSRLHAHCPALTRSDEFLCMLIKMKINNKEAMKRLSISQGSLHTTRYRLKLKLAIPREEELDEWIQRL